MVWWRSWRQRRRKARAHAALHRVEQMAERVDAESRTGIHRLVEEWEREDAASASASTGCNGRWWNEPTVANAPVLARPYVYNSRGWWRA